MRRLPHPTLTFGAVLAVICVSQPVSHAADTFVVDPAQSQIELSGDMAGFDVGPQGEGSLQSSFSGTLMVETTTDTIHFVGGSVLDAGETGSWQPLVGGDAGSAPADFGAQASLGILGSGVAALRNVIGDMVTEQPLLLTAGEFDATDVRFLFPEGGAATLDYRVVSLFSTLADTEMLEGYATNDVATTGSLTEQNGTRTLTIPLNARYPLTLLSENDSLLEVTGQLVATASAAPQQPVLGEISLEDGRLGFSWPSEEGQMFRILRSEDLVTWTPVEVDYPAQPGDTTSWSTELGDGDSFYRVSR